MLLLVSYLHMFNKYLTYSYKNVNIFENYYK